MRLNRLSRDDYELRKYMETPSIACAKRIK